VAVVAGAGSATSQQLVGHHQTSVGEGEKCHRPAVWASGHLQPGFFYRPKVADISEISFLSPGSDKI
jgi:hypothetical protein